MIDSVYKYKDAKTLQDAINRNPKFVAASGTLWDGGKDMGKFDTVVASIPYGRSVTAHGNENRLYRISKGTDGGFIVQ
jgi:hypothetical protein